MAVLEVGRPAAQEPVQVLRDQLRPQPQPAPPGQLPDAVTGMLHGPVRGPAGQERHPRFPVQPPRAHQPVVKAEEIETLASLLQMDDAGLGRLRLQAEPGQQDGQPLQRGLGLAAGPAHHDQVISEPDQHPIAVVPCPVQPVQVDVAHDGADHPALRGAGVRTPDLTVLHHPCPQHRAQQLQDRLVTDAFLYRLHQLLMRNRGKAARDVRLDHPPAAPRALVNEHLQGILLRPPRAEPEADRQEACLEDRLEHDLHRGLHDPVTDRRNRQRPLLARRRARLRDIDPARGQRAVAALLQFAGQLAEQPVYAVLLDASQGDLVDARRAVIPAHRDPRAPQDIPAADLVIQRVEPPPGIGLGRPVQRMLQGTDRISRDTPARSRSGGTSTTGTHRAPPRRHCAPTKQRPFPHRRLSARLNQYYGRLRRPPGQPSTSRGHRL